MEIKQCSKCGEVLPVDQFHWRDKATGKRRTECKKCHSTFMNQKYQEKKQIVTDLKSQNKCAKCGESRGYVLDYHHINPKNKTNTISRMTSNKYRLDKTMEEIKKCICLCSNCHREFHYFNKSNRITLAEYLELNNGGLV